MFFIHSYSAKATHIYGADFYYTHVSGNTYTISLDVYGDCSGSAFPTLTSSAPGVDVYDSLNLVQSITLSLQGPGVEVTPVCPSQIGNTSCNGGSLPGVMKFHYSNTINLGYTSAHWLFRFTGAMNNNTSAGRSISITNIVNSATPGQGSIMVLEARLNNIAAPNSSVIYTTIPTPFFCINIPAQFNPGAVDPNNDNLNINLVDGIEPGGLVTYIPPYTATQPLAVAPGSFSFSTSTGQLSFTPNLIQRSLVVYRVNEYRNNILVGTSMREMTFVVLNNCNNTPPAPGPITGLTMGVLTAPTVIQVCQGSSGNLAFHFTASDVNGDHINITTSGLPSGATANVSNNGSTAPQYNFSWNISAQTSGTFTFYVTFKDDGCPLASSQTIAYTIIIEPFSSLYTTGFVSGCINESNGEAWVTPTGTGTNSYTWTNSSGQIVHQVSNITNTDTAKLLGAGIYSVHIVNAYGCDTTIPITIPVSNYHAGFKVDSAACLSAPVAFTDTSYPGMSSWEWSFGDGGTAQIVNPSHTYNQTGSYTIRLITHTVNGCADTAFRNINIRKLSITVSNDTTVCQGVPAIMSVFGGSTFLWKPIGFLSCPTCQTTFALPPQTTTFTVIATDNIGCKDSGKITINILPTGLLISPPDSGVCPGDSLQLIVSGYDSVFHWVDTMGLSDTSNHPWVHPKGNLSYTVTADYKNGCHDTATAKVHLFSNAVIYLPDSARIFPGESYQMDPRGNCLYYHWWPPLGLSNVDISNPIAQPPVNTRYYVNGTTEGGCKTTDSIDIYVSLESLLAVPNAFTPGSNGINNIIKVIRRGEATLKYFRIYDRWGNKVFETNNIDEGWDGTYHGVPQPMDVYVYVVEAYTKIGTRFYKQGNITLIK